MSESDTKKEEAPEAEKDARDFLDVSIDVAPLLAEVSSSKVVKLRLSPQDNGESIRTLLSEIGETHCANAFSFTVGDGAETETVSEYAQLESFFEEPNQSSLFLKTVLDFYDEKKAREHARKVRNFVKYPYVATAALRDFTVESEEDQGKVEEDKKQSVKAVEDSLPEKAIDYDEITSTDKTLSRFYEEMLYRVGDVDRSSLPQSVLSRMGVNSNVQLPSDCIKGVCESGWSPPSPARRMQGDLIYLEVTTASEGVLQITGTAQGFFVNMSSRNHFDPRPSTKKPCFHHSLLECLRMAVPAFEISVTEHFSKPSKDRSSDMRGITRSLSSVATIFAHGRADASMKELQWNLPPTAMIGGKSGPVYDLNRAQMAMSAVSEDLLAAGVLDSSSSPREWNEDLQASNRLPSETMQDKILRAKFSYKTFTDFEMVVRAGVVDIVEGKVPPYNPLEPGDMQVYLHQGIFYSAATDMKEGLKLSSGDAASRKTAKQDLHNMRKIHEMVDDLDGLCSVLQVVVDYKGSRFIAQTVIPGILNAADGGGRLMYGSVEAGVRLRAKKEALELMRAVGKRLHLSERNVPAVPKEKNKEDAQLEAEQQARLKEQYAYLGDMTDEPASPLRVDDEDEFDDLTSPSVTHVGPLEAKIIQGADKRMYVLELYRLTPRDANYVPKEAGGTGLLEKDGTVASADEEIVMTYVLRHELIEHYLQSKLEAAKQEVVTEHMKAREEYYEQLQKESKAREEEGKELSEEDKKAEGEKQLKVFAQFQEDIQKGLAAVTIEAVAPDFQVNPNVFFNEVSADIDADQVKKDEAVARELASFLVENVIPGVTAEVRKGGIAPLDNANAVTVLHQYGINMRYLGLLARRAREAEASDYRVDTTQKDSTTVYRMPAYWRDLLEVEMVARGTRILLDRLLKEHKRACQSPAATIASLLSHILDGGDKAATESSTKSEKDASPEDGTETAEGGAKKGKKNKSKNKKKSDSAAAAAAAAATTEASSEIGSTLFAPFDAAADGAAMLASLDSILQKRFGYSLADISATPATDEPKLPKSEGQEDLPSEAKEKEAESKAAEAETGGGGGGPLGRRIPRTMLLRRICQLAGLRVATKDYDFSSKASRGKPTFVADDIGDLQPRLKSNAPSHPLPEAKALVSRSSQCIKQGDLQSAYFLAQEAQTAVHSITGPNSLHMLDMTEHLADIIQFAAGGEDTTTSLLLNIRNLEATVLLTGLDSARAVSLHIKIGDLMRVTGEYKEALQHYLAARYGLTLAGGRAHPIHVELTRRMADLCFAGGLLDTPDVYHLLESARFMASNYPLKAEIGLSLGKLLSDNKAYEPALNHFTQSHKILEQLRPEDPKTKEAKEAMLAVKRKLVELGVEARKHQQEQMEKQRVIQRAATERKKAEDAQNKKQSEINSKRYKQALENARSRAGRR